MSLIGGPMAAHLRRGTTPASFGTSTVLVEETGMPAQNAATNQHSPSPPLKFLNAPPSPPPFSSTPYVHES